MWTYGLPKEINDEHDLEIFCFNELQSEAFSDNPVYCTPMQKRFCCKNSTAITFSKRSKRSFPEIVAPSLSEIDWNLHDSGNYVILGNVPCREPFLTDWISYDVPTDGTGDHELFEQIDPCGDLIEPTYMEVRERNYQSIYTYSVRNIIFHKRGQKYHLGPDKRYGLRLVKLQ